MSFQYIPLNGRLTTSQENLLDRIENAVSPYQGIKCLKDLRGLTGVSVIVSDKACLKIMLKAFVEEIKHQQSNLRKDISVKQIDFFQKERELNRILQKAMYDLEKVDNPNVMPLLGLYTRKYLWFDDSNPYVILFADNIKDYARVHGTNVDNVFGYVFIHEMMHAYYDAFNADGFPARSELEEAFAEYGMLTFINKTPSLGSSLLNDARAHVALKKRHGPHEYGFGYDLYDLTGGGDPRMMNRYKDISNWIDLDVIYSWKSTGKHNYFDDLFYYSSNPFNSINSNNCYLGVMNILEYDWKQPHIILQRAVRGGASSSRSSSRSSRRTSHVLPPWLSRIAPHGLSPIVSSTGTGSSSSMFRAGEWALSATAAESSWQFKLLQSPDKMSFIAEFVKALKRDNIESYLSLDGRNHITFLGKEFCEYSSTSGGSSRILSESLCVAGTTVYPVIDDPLTMKQFRSLLHAACVLYDAEFTVVCDASGFTLYGPDSCAASFVSPTPAVSSTSGPGRFHFKANAKYYPGTTGHSGDRIVINLPQEVYGDIVFINDYDFHKAPFDIKITFEDSKGKSISGDAKVYKGSATAHPERMRIYIESDKALLKCFNATYGLKPKQFKFTEIRPGVGSNPPEWIAREL